MPHTQPPSLTNPRLVTALAHPTRLHAMRVFWERAATPREVAAQIDEPLNNVAYHVKVLLRLNCIELVEARQAQGGRVAEHLYRATQRYQIWDAPAWERLSEAEKLDVARAILHQIAQDIAEAMATGTFYEDVDNHVSRMPMSLDKEGWDEVVSLLEGTLDTLFDIQARADERRVESEQPVTHTKVEIIHFRSPPPKTT